MNSRRLATAVVAVAATAVLLVGTAFAGSIAPWAPAQKIDEIFGNSSELNTAFIDGCPIQSPDGLSLYLASSRPRFAGDTRTDLDIWVARREQTRDAWGPPENLGEPVNSAADDFCPTPIRSGGLFFVSRQALPGSCGLGDIYFTRDSRWHGWSEPQHLACAPEGPNSALDEQGPSYVTAGKGAQLYFSRSAATVAGEVYVAHGRAGFTFRPAAPVAELNDPGQRHPAERAQGRSRGGLLVQPGRDPRRPGHLGRDQE
jgi:hypothetical protein